MLLLSFMKFTCIPRSVPECSVLFYCQLPVFPSVLHCFYYYGIFKWGRMVCLQRCRQTTRDTVGPQASNCGGRVITIPQRRKRLLKHKTEKAVRRGHCRAVSFHERHSSPMVIPWGGPRRKNTLILLSSLPSVSCWSFSLTDPTKSRGQGRPVHATIQS